MEFKPAPLFPVFQFSLPNTILLPNTCKQASFLPPMFVCVQKDHRPACLCCASSSFSLIELPACLLSDEKDSDAFVLPLSEAPHYHGNMLVCGQQPP